MPPEPLVAFDVISARDGRPASLPAPTPTPTPVPTPGPGLTGASCTAIGAPCSSARSFDIASKPTPAALRRAASISPGGLFGTGTRASGTGTALGTVSLIACLLVVASGLARASGLTTGGGGGGSGLTFSRIIVVNCAGSSRTERSGSDTGTNSTSSA